MSNPIEPWYARNSLRDYPLLDRSTIPEGLIVDAGFVIDPDTGFNPSVHTVRITKIEKIVGGYLITVGVDCDVDGSLSFPVSDNWTEWLTVRSDPPEWNNSGSSSQSTGWSSPPGSWFGFLVLGRYSDWVDYLPSGSVTFTAGQADFEPARTAINRARIRAIRIANQQRLQARDPDGCGTNSESSIVNQLSDLPYVEWGPPLTAPIITLVEGYNLSLRVLGTSELVFAARPGYGAGEVCEEVPLKDGEEAPSGSELLTGGPSCAELVRAINGLPGKSVRVTSGPGIDIIEETETHTVRVRLDTGVFGRYPDGSSSSQGG